MRAIDADALERDYRDQFEAVYKGIRDSVTPADFYIERKAAYDKALVKMEMEAFCKYLQSRPTIDPVKRAKWVQPEDGLTGCLVCSNCRTFPISKDGRWKLTKYCPECGAKMEE